MNISRTRGDGRLAPPPVDRLPDHRFNPHDRFWNLESGLDVQRPERYPEYVRLGIWSRLHRRVARRKEEWHHPKLTGYHILVITVTASFGVSKAVLSSQGKSVEATSMDLILGVFWASVSIPKMLSGIMAWFFTKGYFRHIAGPPDLTLRTALVGIAFLVMFAFAALIESSARIPDFRSLWSIALASNVFETLEDSIHGVICWLIPGVVETRDTAELILASFPDVVVNISVEMSKYPNIVNVPQAPEYFHTIPRGFGANSLVKNTLSLKRKYICSWYL
ncbi:hypothetical protein BD410DRAFT_805936 [Rickenella mellea]|uniref:Uncharacterized protein n=1 Tax=Rickenella mellea TaxID=50990 RepID=A0A4Y7PW57_9AGAM|nr:hypothetical protein BD410DRAFT_805936 [Rickenella mellea]